MKKIFYIFCMLLVPMAITMPASAMKKCVPFEYDNTIEYDAHDDQSEWTAVDNYGTKYHGIAACAGGGAANSYQNAINLYFSTDGPNPHCWCRLLLPAVSQWIYVGGGGATTYDCAGSCAYLCAMFFGEDAFMDFRAAMLNSTAKPFSAN